MVVVEPDFNVSFDVRGKVTRQCQQAKTFERKREPKRGIEPTLSTYQHCTRPLGHTGRDLPDESWATRPLNIPFVWSLVQDGHLYFHTSPELWALHGLPDCPCGLYGREAILNLKSFPLYFNVRELVIHPRLYGNFCWIFKRCPTVFGSMVFSLTEEGSWLWSRTYANGF